MIACGLEHLSQPTCASFFSTVRRGLGGFSVSPHCWTCSLVLEAPSPPATVLLLSFLSSSLMSPFLSKAPPQPTSYRWVSSLFHLLLRSLGDLIPSLVFNHHPQAESFQISIFSPDICPGLQFCDLSCPWYLSTCMPYRHVTVNRSKLIASSSSTHSQSWFILHPPN